MFFYRDETLWAGFVPQIKGTQQSVCCTVVMIRDLINDFHVSCRATFVRGWGKGFHATSASFSPPPPPSLSYTRKCYHDKNEKKGYTFVETSIFKKGLKLKKKNNKRKWFENCLKKMNQVILIFWSSRFLRVGGKDVGRIQTTAIKKAKAKIQN